ncbi:hypothetical protein ACQ4WX_29970 [Streptomyces lasalocidi]
MADEHDKWLNRETAERLLRGESLEVVDARARDQAERLSRALGALSVQGLPPPVNFPANRPPWPRSARPARPPRPSGPPPPSPRAPSASAPAAPPRPPTPV